MSVRRLPTCYFENLSQRVLVHLIGNRFYSYCSSIALTYFSLVLLIMRDSDNNIWNTIMNVFCFMFLDLSKISYMGKNHV